MPDKEHEKKLSDKMQMQVCAWIAEGWNAERIAQEIKDEWDIDISRAGIFANYIKAPKWQGIINNFRKGLEKELLKVPIANKKVRLKILERAANEAFTWRIDRVVYDKDGKEIERIEKRQIGTIPAIIDQARKEVEGNKIILQDSKVEDVE